MEDDTRDGLAGQLRAVGAGPELLAEIAASVGVGPDELRAGGKVIGGWAEADSDMFTCWAVTRNLLGLHQRSRSGQAFTLTVTPARIRRVALISDQDGALLTLELDADRQTHVPGDSGKVVVLHAGYELRAAGPQLAQLLDFSRALRAAMAGRGA